jgi:hypothetical protein
VLIIIFVAIGVVIVLLAIIQRWRSRDDVELESGGSWGDQIDRDKE